MMSELKFQKKPNLLTGDAIINMAQVHWKGQSTAFYVGRLENNMDAPYFLLYKRKHIQLVDEFIVCVWTYNNQPVMHFSSLVMKAEVEHILSNTSIAVYLDKVIIIE